MRRFLIVATLMIQGCSSNKIRPDNVDPKHTYNSAEIIVENKRQLGLMAAKVERNRPFVFSVQGIHNGKIRVDSKACGLSRSQIYKNYEEVPFVAHVNDRHCVIAISVFPEFTPKESDGVTWRHYSGVLVLWIDNKPVLSQTGQFERDEDVKFKFENFENTYFDFDGCGLHNDHGYFPVGITEKTFRVDKTRPFCVIDGVFQSRSHTRTHILLYSLFDNGFMPLSYPSITFSEDRIDILADQNTSLIEFQGKAVFGNKARFKYDLTPGYLRVNSSGGRAILCRIWEREYSCQR